MMMTVTGTTAGDTRTVGRSLLDAAVSAYRAYVHVKPSRGYTSLGESSKGSRYLRTAYSAGSMTEFQGLHWAR